ncbi:MAG: diaminopimelate epimerase [Gammaproteobacteria bacterium]|nr:diaminopimelate epimerase [Gammaproteobacteria bacterium]
MTLKFSKMHGLGNDFMVIDAISQHFEPDPVLIHQWANRHTGIGFDQMLIVEKPQSEQAAFRYRIFNADGGEVAQCGNGARCFARFVLEQGLTDLDIIPVETNTGLLELQMIDAIRVRVNMGVPNFEPQQIPLDQNLRQDQYSIKVDYQLIEFSALSIGNPHIVIQVHDVDSAPLETLGPVLESHRFFPERVNVGFMQVFDNSHFKLRVFERGVGETRACGSGACAAHAAGVQLGLLDAEATAQLSGGDLKLEWQGEGNPVMMTGETAMVFQGDIEYEQK